MKFHQRINFRHLQCFLEVARQGSVGKAAISLAITRPAVSKSNRELEEILEVKLFDRSNRKISLTRFGDVFLRYASTSVTAIKKRGDNISTPGLKKRLRSDSAPYRPVLPELCLWP